MKILLIIPTHHYKTEYPCFLSVSDFPSGFAYLASSLTEAGHEVYGLNLNNITGYPSAYDMIQDNIINALKTVKPDLVGLGGICIDYKFLKDTMQIIRANSNVKIVIGGGIINNDAEYIFNLLKPDFCIKGDGEETLVKLANYLDHPDYATVNGSLGVKGNVTDLLTSGRALNTISNLGYWQDSKSVFTREDFNYRDINKRPFPDFDSFGIKNMVDNYSMSTRVLYRYSRPYPRPFIIVTARGCPFRCTFCVKHASKYRPRSIENIMAEIAVNYEKYKFNILIVQDELFVSNNQRMKDFCTTLIELKEKNKWDFDWMMQTHANSKLDLETLQLAKKSGCYLFSYGLESASPTILKSMDKKTQPSQIIEAIKMADKVGIGFAGNLIFGDCAETEDTIRETMKFYFRYGINPFLFLGFIQPYPGSSLFDYCIEKGIIKDKLEYYERIDEGIRNMTTIPDSLWAVWINFLAGLENSYLLIKSSNAHAYQKENSDTILSKHYGLPIMKIWVNCPHCGKENMYREMLGDRDLGKFLVPGCQHCNKRIRVNLPTNMKEIK